MIWTLQTFLGQLFDATMGQMVDGLGQPRSGSSGPPWNDEPFELRGIVVPDAEPAAQEEMRRARDLGGDEVKLVRFAIVSVRRGHERILPGGLGEVLVTNGMTSESFATWVVALYLQSDRFHGLPLDRRNQISHEDKKYLRVSYLVLDRWPREPLHCQEQQLDRLAGIRDALRALPPVAAPVSRAAPPQTEAEPGEVEIRSVEPAAPPEAAMPPEPELPTPPRVRSGGRKASGSSRRKPR